MADRNSSTVVGVFDDYAAAERVARELVDAGISRDDIHLRSNLATAGAGRSSVYDTEHTEHHEGGISGFFHRLFHGSDASDDETGHYAEAVRRGSTVVAATAATQEMLDRAAEIMNRNGALDIDHRVAAYRQTGYERYDPASEPYTREQAIAERERYQQSGREQTIPVVEEELEVGKRVVQRGGVRVFSRVVEKPVEEDVHLREEHVRVERRPADRPVTDADRAALKDQSVEITETAEEPVVSKRRRVREEIVVGKETSERVQKVRDTVQHTEVKVEPIRKDRRGKAEDEERHE